jgi:Lrp/AsnC family transcriptional regulator, leucine-responsive regulatory protein
MIDAIDSRLIELLQEDSRMSNQDMAQAVGLTASSVFERVKKLEQKRIILGYGARVDPTKLGKPLLAFVRLSFNAIQGESTSEAMARLALLCESEADILECHDVAGEDCLVLKIRAAGPKELQRVLASVRDCARNSRSVTNIVLSTIKESSMVSSTPVGDAEG